MNELIFDDFQAMELVTTAQINGEQLTRGGGSCLAWKPVIAIFAYRILQKKQDIYGYLWWQFKDIYGFGVQTDMIDWSAYRNELWWGFNQPPR